MPTCENVQARKVKYLSASILELSSNLVQFLVNGILCKLMSSHYAFDNALYDLIIYSYLDTYHGPIFPLVFFSSVIFPEVSVFRIPFSFITLF